MSKPSREQIDRVLSRLARLVNIPYVGNGAPIAGALGYDCATVYGGFRLVVYTDTGREQQPFGSRRRRLSELEQLIDFAGDVLAFVERERGRD